MKLIRFTTSAAVALTFLLALGADSNAFAQGRGRGGGAGKSGQGSGGGIGKPTSPGVDRGIFTSAEKSGGRSTQGRDNASDSSNGRYDEGIARARQMRENRIREADREIERNPNIKERLKMNANDLRSGYQNALLSNPDLKFGQYVAAHMISRNLSSRYPNITSSAILAGLADGDSIGETLRELGVGKDEAKRAEKEAKRQFENGGKND